MPPITATYVLEYLAAVIEANHAAYAMKSRLDTEAKSAVEFRQSLGLSVAAEVAVKLCFPDLHAEYRRTLIEERPDVGAAVSVGKKFQPWDVLLHIWVRPPLFLASQRGQAVYAESIQAIWSLSRCEMRALHAGALLHQNRGLRPTVLRSLQGV
jgi:hypothetical protein